jgi:thymidylate synthase (FAD)
LFRHRTHSANEVSGRYSVIETEFYTPSREHFKAQSKDNKQGRDGEVDDGVYSTAISRWGAGREEASYTYDALLEAGVSRELARIDLPLSTYTEFFWKQDLGNLLHLMSLRCDSHAQWEIRQYANVMAGMVKQLFPLTFEAWWDYSFGARTFSRQELLRLQGHASEMSEREESEFDQKLHGPVLPDWTTAFPLDPNNLIAEENDAVVQD